MTWSAIVDGLRNTGIKAISKRLCADLHPFTPTGLCSDRVATENFQNDFSRSRSERQQYKAGNVLCKRSQAGGAGGAGESLDGSYVSESKRRVGSVQHQYPWQQQRRIAVQNVWRLNRLNFGRFARPLASPVRTPPYKQPL
jgi:hypothetical protein